MASSKKERNVLEDSDVVVEKLESVEDFFKENQKIVYVVVALVLLAIAGFFGYNYYNNTKTAEAQAELFRPVSFFESDSLNKAVKGDGNSLGFSTIADDFGSTKPGKLASFYAGAAYLKQGKFQEAIDHLENFNSSDILVQARAYSLLGDAHMELKHFDEAAANYQKAADYKPNKFYSPTYLMKAALAYEKKGDNDAAIKAYNDIIEKYFDSAEFNDARKNKSKLEGLLAK